MSDKHEDNELKATPSGEGGSRKRAKLSIIPVELIEEMGTMPAEEFMVCVWLSFRHGQGFIEAARHGADPVESDCTVTLAEVAAVAEFSERRALAALEARAQAGYVRLTDTGWLMVRYVAEIPGK